tara:strand:+ start:8461 stop:8820 length:360 start_codon:yes stop_codon:yes gene_type:complete
MSGMITKKYSVPKRAFDADIDETEVFLITGVAEHVYRIQSVIFAEQGGNTGTTIEMSIDANAAGTDVFLFKSEALPPNQTFVWNEPIIMQGTDKLRVKATVSGADVDVWVSYIDEYYEN